MRLATRCLLPAVAAAVLATVTVTAQNAKPKPGRFYVIGTGTAPDLLTIRGAAAIKQGDLFVVETEEEARWFADLIAGRPVLIAPHAARIFYGVDPNLLDNAEAKDLCVKNAKVRQEVVDKIRAAVEAGKSVVALQGGDAMMYGTTWYLEMLPKDFPSEVVPGIGSFQAATAAVQRNPVFGYDTNSAVVTMADFPGRQDTNEKLMVAQTSLIVYTMHLDYADFFAKLAKHYPAKTPVAVVEYAGDREKQKVIRSTVGTFLKEVDYKNLALDMHLLLVGKFLECGQARIDGLRGGLRYIERVHGLDGKKQ